MRPMPKLAVLAAGAALLLMAGVAQAASAPESAPESAAASASASNAQERELLRARIEDERSRIEVQFNADMAACRQRFVVTACVDNARRRRRDALTAPRAEELTLDDLQRRERAAVRREVIQAKQREAASQAAAPLAASAPGERVRPGPSTATQTPAQRADPGAAASAAQASARQRANAARERQAQIEATQARIRERQAERLREGKLAAPLPVPAASR